jgi:hypothetical protein
MKVRFSVSQCAQRKAPKEKRTLFVQGNKERHKSRLDSNDSNKLGCVSSTTWAVVQSRLKERFKSIVCATPTSVCNWGDLFAFEYERTLTTFLTPR